jgi:thiamine pyrophosphokinase
MRRKMLGLAIIGGEGPKSETLKKIARGADIIAAADSGLVAAEEAGLKPDWVIGDMDSIKSSAFCGGAVRLEKYPAERVIRYPHDKDSSDTELAIALLREKGCDEILIAGGGGGRTDHLFAIRALFERENPPNRWFTAGEEIRCLDEGSVVSASLLPGSIVSVFPLGNEGWEAESVGLKWPLDGLAWERGGFGVSNAAQDGPFEIRSVRGRFMVVMPMTINDEGENQCRR